MNPVFSVNLTKEAFVRLTEFRDVVEEITGQWLPLNQLCSTLICQVCAAPYEDLLDEKTA